MRHKTFGYGTFAIHPPQDPRGTCWACGDRRRPAGSGAVDDQYRYQRYRGKRGADRADRRCGLLRGAPDHAGTARGREPRAYRRPSAGRRLRHGRGRRRPFSPRRGSDGGVLCGQGAHQSGQLCRPGRRVREADRPLPRAGRGPAHRGEPRLARPPHRGRMGRYAARHGGVGDGVPAPLPGAGLRPGGGLDEVEQHAGDGGGLPAAGRRDGPRGDGLSPASGRYRGGKRTGGAHQERRGNRGAARRRHRRHDPRFADRSPRARDTRRAAAGGPFRRASGPVPRPPSRAVLSL